MDYHVEVHQSGRITIPASIRKEFSVNEGDILTIRQEEQTLKIITTQQAMEQARALAAPYLGANTSVDDFLKWRKGEAWESSADDESLA